MDFFDFLKNNKFIILIVTIIMNILLIGMSGFLLYKNINYKPVCENNNLVVNESAPEETIDDAEEIFYVEIKGAVKNPGVYEANSSSLINDIVTVAGGFTKKAYTKNINLSRKVTNELVIYVFTESEYKKNNAKTITKAVQEKCECSTYDISNCTDNLVSEIVSSDKDTTFEDDTNSENEVENKTSLVNINIASKEELMTLSGIGEAKAEDIIEYRNSLGSFKSAEEIKNVSGIGDALFNKIKDNITV
ncbi:MAG: hypothetical protein E7161_05445 [Firmicutes bacterium]|nr:hypothetical protein [Bacillota bacterium]